MSVYNGRDRLGSHIAASPVAGSRLTDSKSCESHCDRGGRRHLGGGAAMTSTTISDLLRCAYRVLCASDIKRFRRTKAAITDIKKAIFDILSADNPQTVRQVFYALTVRGVIEKAEIEYQRTVIRLLVEMREAGQIPFEWIADNTRWMRKPSTFTGLESCLNSTARLLSPGSVGGDAGLRRGLVREGRARRRADGGDRGLRRAADGGARATRRSASCTARPRRSRQGASPPTSTTSAISTLPASTPPATSRPSCAGMRREPRSTSSGPR